MSEKGATGPFIMLFFYRLTRRLVLASMVALLLVLIHRSVDCVITYRDVETNHDKLSARMEDLQLRNAELEQECNRLATDFSYYEQLAREEFGYVKADEVIYLVPLH